MADKDDALFTRLKKLFKADRDFSADWRKAAKEDFDFVAGEQWSEEDKAHLKSLMRPVITMNRTQTVINAVSGQEMANRQEVRFIPREPGDVKPNELLTEGARWFRDNAEGDDEDSEAFLHATVCGMGWTDTTLDFEEEEDGSPEMAAIGPLEMFWDKDARKNNLTDAERVWRARSISLRKAQMLFPDADPTDLDASWARADDDDEDIKDQDRERLYEDNGQGEPVDLDKNVTVVHCQYIERVDVWSVISPLTGETSEMADGDYKKYAARGEQLGIPVQASRKTKRVIKDCWLGGVVLQKGDALCQDRFRYQCITGYRDENKRTFYGLVRSMKDPQRWANKWLSQTLDIMNSQAKGGLLAEKGVTDNPRQFEKDWARADKITWLEDGSLVGPNGQRVMPKPQGQFPQGFYQLMTFSFEMIQSVPGVSPELMGMADRDQPASLEYQRRQAGMTILQPLFKNLKRYRKEQGRVILYILQKHMSDGRLIRVLGKDSAQYVPLTKQADVRYDIIVDDAPSSPNQKEMVWALIGEKFWELPPNIQMPLLEYSPFPSTVVEKVKQAAQEAQQGEAAQLQQRIAMLEAQLNEAKVGLTQAQTQKTNADAQKTMSEIGQGADPNADLALEQQKQAGQFALQREKQVGDFQLKQQAQAGDMALKVAGQRADMQLQREKAASDVSIKAYSAQQAAKNRPAQKAAN